MAPNFLTCLATGACRRRTPVIGSGDGAAGRAGMSKTVMIVEDNELNMKLFHDLLEAHGYRTVGTRNGIEALDLQTIDDRMHRFELTLLRILSYLFADVFAFSPDEGSIDAV